MTQEELKRKFPSILKIELNAIKKMILKSKSNEHLLELIEITKQKVSDIFQNVDAELEFYKLACISKIEIKNIRKGEITGSANENDALRIIYSTKKIKVKDLLILFATEELIKNKEAMQQLILLDYNNYEVIKYYKKIDKDYVLAVIKSVTNKSDADWSSISYIIEDLPKKLQKNILIPSFYFKTAKDNNYGQDGIEESVRLLFDNYNKSDDKYCGYEHNLEKKIIKNWIDNDAFIQTIDFIDPNLNFIIQKYVTEENNI